MRNLSQSYKNWKRIAGMPNLWPTCCTYLRVAVNVV